MKMPPLLAILLGTCPVIAELASAPINTPPQVALPAQPQTLRQAVDGLSPSQIQEALHLLKTNYLAPEAVSPQALERATLEGLLLRLAPGASIRPAQEKPESVSSPFRSEVLNQTVGYLRLGSFNADNIGQMNAALAGFAGKDIKSVVLDLRATPESNDFNSAAQVAEPFCQKDKPLFSISRPGQEQKLSSQKDPLFTGLTVVLVNGETAGAPEVLAGVLRQQTRAMVVGSETKGQGAELAALPMSNGMVLRVAVAKVALPDGQSLYPKGLKADLPVEVAPETRQEVLRMELEKGVAQFVFETERPRRNEAALVAGTNPELDPAQIAQRKAANGKTPLRDVELQRALDLITSIEVYESKRQ